MQAKLYQMFCTFSSRRSKIPPGMSNSLEPDRADHFVGSDSARGPNFCKIYQQMTLAD